MVTVTVTVCSVQSYSPVLYPEYKMSLQSRPVTGVRGTSLVHGVATDERVLWYTGHAVQYRPGEHCGTAPMWQAHGPGAGSLGREGGSAEGMHTWYCRIYCVYF